MSNPEHLAKLKEGVEAWNKWRKDNEEDVPPSIRPLLLGKIQFAEPEILQVSAYLKNCVA